MISRENYFEPHIRELQNSSKGDPGLIERTLYAFGLLEALRRVGMEFTFKGGTSLLLLLSRTVVPDTVKRILNILQNCFKLTVENLV